MKKRMILMLAAVGIVIAVLAAIKTRQIKAAMAQNASFQMPPESVTTIVAKELEWPTTLSAIGSAVAVHGVTVSADLPGIVDQISFESGRPVKEGEVLVTLDTKQERAQLAAAEAQRDLTSVNLERVKGLSEKQVLSQAELDRADAESKQAAARVGEIKATIARKTIRAPFAGILGIRQVSLGQYLSPGDPIVPLQSLQPIHVDFAVPQQDVAALKVGGEIRVSSDEAAGTTASTKGKITAIDSVVDEATRNVRVRATLQNADRRLRPGMYVRAEVDLGAARKALTVPASAISYAPFGDSVFIVEDMKGPDGKSYKGARQQFVKLGGGRGDVVAVLSGIKAGEEIVSSGTFKLRNGAAVSVNNKVQPGNSPAPKPEDS
jgi:membrane fusion protein (multidrug efflux system)